MRNLILLVGICLSIASTVTGQSVGLLGDWQTIEFEGLKEVTADSIRAALAGDLEFQAAARPSNSLVEFVDKVNHRITQGFRHSGYARAEVRSRYDVGKRAVVVTVSEGSRYYAGKIRVINNQGVDAQLLTNALTSPRHRRAWSYRWGKQTAKQSDSTDAPPVWREKEQLQVDKGSSARLAETIRESCADKGYPYARPKVKVDFSADAASIPLEIDLSVEHNPAKVSRQH
jgi:outer membrane protein assembly factor BamA